MICAVLPRDRPCIDANGVRCNVLTGKDYHPTAPLKCFAVIPKDFLQVGYMLNLCFNTSITLPMFSLTLTGGLAYLQPSPSTSLEW